MYGWRRDSDWWGMGALATPPPAIQTALQNASNQYGVPLSLLQSVAFTESSYRPGITSTAGAQGLMQIMPANFASLGVTNPLDPQQSADAGAKLLSQLYAQYGDWNTALIAYNEGSGNLAKFGPYQSSQDYAATILQNSGLSTPTSPSGSDSTASGASDSGGDSSLFDFSALDSSNVSPGGLSPLAWLGIAVAGIAAAAWMAG